MKKVKLILMGFLALSLIFSTFSCAKDAPDTTPGNNNSQNFDDEDEDEELDDEDEDENEDLPEGSDNYCTITFHSNDGKNQVYTQKFLIGGSNIYHKLKPSNFHREGYIFEGWAKEADATEPKYENETTISNLFFI